MRGREGVGQDEQAVGPAAWGSCVVVAGDQAGDTLGQLGGEGGPLGGRAEADLGVHGEGREKLVGSACAAPEVGRWGGRAGA